MESEVNLKGRLSASLLNVRREPALHSDVMGSLILDSRIDILDETGEWLEIAFNGRSAFVHQDFVEVLETRIDDFAFVDADRLNVRARPDVDGTLLGSLDRDTKVKILGQTGKWCEIKFNDISAYIHGDYLERGDSQKAPSTHVIKPADQQETISDRDELEPVDKLPLTGGQIDKKVARTWNKFGGLLTNLCGAYRIEPGAAVAVLCVESSGKGFEARNQNRMIIRFENHLFWKYWGKQNPEKFHKHFKYGKYQNNKLKVWLGHSWRPDPTGSWQTFHGSQPKEWNVLEFARSLSDSDALTCISMGMPQVMGFNYKAIGYNSVEEMFDKFNSDIRYHIQGLFDFFDKRMIRALQKRDFVEFAGYYNGSGQKQKYGQWIQNHYDAFQQFTS
ncbi:MAG: DUF3380 domain-containing protein [Calditrichaeota bacterium]|nr:MAG: DUF3380 domain-containing protein [Calditrichota bacterium]